MASYLWILQYYISSGLLSFHSSKIAYIVKLRPISSKDYTSFALCRTGKLFIYPKRVMKHKLNNRMTALQN
jgi:hypothetical protein